jgi:pimeloyl-ACP methyl ester carboxylesterase
MPTAICDGIETRYEIAGEGPPLLLFSPGGFNAALENWRTFGIYRRLGLLDRLPARFTCVVFDKRESGRSGGRVERITWDDYARQALALLDELHLDRAHLMGGCVGCSIAATLAASHPERVDRLVLYSPAGGPRYRLLQRQRFAAHVEYVDEAGLPDVVQLARAGDATFSQDPRVGPWVSVIRLDAAFADEYARRHPEEYRILVDEMARRLFDRDTVPGPDAEALLRLELPTLVVPGNDPNHALSAARYLEECLTGSEYWDVPPEAQTAENAPARVIRFLQQ